MTMTGPRAEKPFDDGGGYVTVYEERADGSWKAIEDINTSEVAPQ